MKKVNDKITQEIKLNTGYKLDTEDGYIEIVSSLPFATPNGFVVNSIRVCSGKLYATYTRHTYIGIIEFLHYGADLITFRKLNHKSIELRDILIHTVLSNSSKMIYPPLPPYPPR